MTCIYCKDESSTSKRQAHVAPQGLMRSDVCLPPGAECDPCNEYAGQLETAFLHHNRIWPILIMAGIPGKKGRPRKRLGHFNREQDRIWVDVHPSNLTIKGTSLHVQLPDPAEYDELKCR